jgi:hypothetical protein
MRMVPSARSKIQEKLMTRFRFQDLEIWKEAVGIGNIVIVHPHPNPSPSRGRELIRFADKYSPSSGGRGLGGGGAELLRNILFDIAAPGSRLLAPY